MKLTDLGFDDNLEKYRQENGLTSFDIGRVLLEHKERFVVGTENGEYEAELMGSLRFNAESRRDLPAVGDWVAVMAFDENKALIHAIYPRKSIIERQEVGKKGQKQIIAANIDFGLIVQAVGRDFNINRIERYLTICHSANVQVIIILTKIDLISPQELKDTLISLEGRIKDIPIHSISNESKKGYEHINKMFVQGKTYCLLGSSGVGKSTLTNNISGKDIMETGAISSSVNKGKHVTSHRELIVLPNGAILIDNPGLRAVGITDSNEAIELTFDPIIDIAMNCRYNDCTHINEKGCAVLEAIDNGKINTDAYSNYIKMKKEQLHFESTVLEKRQKDKEFGKMIKGIKKNRKKNKY